MKNWVFLFSHVLLVVGSSLYEDLGILDIDRETPGSTTKRVQFARGETGVKREDLVLSDDQNDWLFGGNIPWLLRNHTSAPEDSGNRTKRAGTEIKPGISWWPQGRIPYVIKQNDFTPEQLSEIREAMNHYEDVTCLVFVVRTNEPQWIYIHNTNDGCYSLLGDARKYSPGPQPISLQEPGCRQFGTYLHELGHAIGLVHEHQLPTRDRHVRYYGTNVDPESADQLEIYNPRVVNTFNTPYDLGSIMHYSITAFAADDTSMTLGIDNLWLAPHIGRRYGTIISFGDAKTINYLYKCPILKGCSMKTIQSCPDGYVDSSCECVTPIKYHQRNCKDANGFFAFCNDLAPSGKCDIENVDHHKKCAKTCGFCPRFLPGDIAIGPQQELAQKACIDRYVDSSKCKKWSKYCSTSRWMHRYCRATCGACGKSQYGDCANIEYDLVCDRYKKMRLCSTGVEATKDFVRSKCPDSCGVCGFRKQDLSCRNKASDEECLKYAREEMCERNSLKMYDQCASTCNRCYWNAGSCANKANDVECTKMALANYCKLGGKRHLQMVQQCGKTCDTCDQVQG